MSLRTFYRRVREQARWCRPCLIAKGDPDHDTVCADIRALIAALPTGSVVLAEDETHLDLLAGVRFLQQLLDAYPDAPVVAVLCDNRTDEQILTTAAPWLPKGSDKSFGQVLRCRAPRGRPRRSRP